MSTYIKLYRALLDNDLLSNDNTAYIVFTKILLKANWKTGAYRTGRKKLGLLTNIKDTTVWAALHRLADAGMLTLTKTGRFTDITISNWWKYQGESEKTVDRSVARSEQLTDTKQEQKNKEVIYTGKELELLELVNRIVQRKFQKLPPVAKSALSQFSLEQIETSLGHLIMDGWHQGKMQTVGIEYLLRPHTLRRFLPSDQPATRPATRKAVPKPVYDKRANMTRKELQALEEQGQ